jgi:hypothetical protein
MTDEISSNILFKILESIEALKKDQESLSFKFDSYQAQNNEELKKLQEKLSPMASISKTTVIAAKEEIQPKASSGPSSSSSGQSIYSDRVILTTYPDQFGIKPISLKWGELDPISRGPIVASRHHKSIKIRFVNSFLNYTNQFPINP